MADLRPNGWHGNGSHPLISIIGLGRTGASVLVELLKRGYSDFVIADESPVLPSDPRWSDVFRREDAGRPRPSVAAERLGARYPQAKIAPSAGPERGLDWYQGWLRSCKVCVLAADSVTEPALSRVNAACLEQNVPLLPGLVMGSVGQIGPLVVAGHGPCLGCLELRVRTATGRSPFPPPVCANNVAAERVALELAAETDRLLTTSPTAVTAVRRGVARVMYSWAEGGIGTHPLLRVPGCPACGNIVPQVGFRSPYRIELCEHPHSDPGRILKLVSEVVDPVMGPIKSLTRYEPGPNDPALHHWVATLADPGWKSFGQEVLFCGGNALTSEVAQAAALGEAMERSATCLVSFEDLVAARYEEIAFEAIDPLAWDLFHPSTRAKAGFPYAPLSRDAEMSWIWGYSLTQQRPVRVPASRVFSPFRAVAEGDSCDAPIISGYCTHSTIEEALYGATMEVIERDAFMIAWANQLRAPRIDIDRSNSGEVGEYLAAFAERGIEVRCTLVDLDLGAHTVIAIAKSDHPGDPAAVVAAAADLDTAAACRRALKELSANRLNVRHEMTQAGSNLPEPDAGLVITERDHGLLYARREMAPHLDIWWSSQPSVPLPSKPHESTVTERLRRCIEVVGRAGLEVVAVDLTAPSVAALGLRTVKVLVPGAYPMLFDGRFPHFGGKRMSMAPVAAGFREKPIAFEDLCTLPHPFP